MFENFDVKKMLGNVTFGEDKSGRVAFSTMGLAVKTKYHGYNVLLNDGTLQNVGDFVFEGFPVFRIPVDVNTLKHGDIVYLNGEYLHVTKVEQDDIDCMNIATGTCSTKKVSKNVLGGNLITKIMTLFDVAGLNGGGEQSGAGLFGNMNTLLPLLLLSDSDSGNSLNKMLPLLLAGNSGGILGGIGTMFGGSTGADNYPCSKDILDSTLGGLNSTLCGGNDK